MISATSNWLAANANLKKKPIFLVEIEGYNRVFSTCRGMPSMSGLVSNPVIQSATRIVDFGGIPFSSSTATLVNPTPSGNLIFAFLCWQGSGNHGISDAAGNTWNLLYHQEDSAGNLTVWYAVSNGTPANNGVTWDPSNTVDHHSQEFYVVEVPASYSAFTYGSTSGTTPAHTPATVSCTVGANTVSFRAGSFSTGLSYQIFQVALAQASGANAGVNLVFWGTEPGAFSLSVPFIGFADHSAVVMAGNATPYDWLIATDDLTTTVSDLDGGADLGDFVFNVQDTLQAITGDMARFIFEGKRCVLLQGFGKFDPAAPNRVAYDSTFDFADYLTLFTGKIDSVASDNSNQEYKFTVPDIRKDMTKVIYQTGDDGFPTDSSHTRTVTGNPLDIFIDILENQLGYAASDIDIAGITAYRDTVLSGIEFVFDIDSPPAAKDFIENELMKPLGAYHYTNNLGVVKIHFFYPIAPASIATIDHTALTTVPQAEQAPLVNQVTFRFDKSSSSFLSESLQQWQPSIAKFGLFGEQVIESAGMRSAFIGFFIAQFIARIIFLRYGDKELQIEGVQAIWSEVLLEPGDYVSLTSSLVPDRTAGVMGVTAKTFEVMDRTWSPLSGLVTLKLLEIDLSLFRQYLITPNGEADFTADTALNQAKYMYLSDAAGVYSDGSPGNTLC